MKGDGADVGTCIHVLVHAHILTKVWAQKVGDWNMYTRPNMIAHFPTTMQRAEADMESWVDMHTCTDAFTLTKVLHQMKGDWDTQAETHRGTHVCAQLCIGGETDV